MAKTKKGGGNKGKKTKKAATVSDVSETKTGTAVKSASETVNPSPSDAVAPSATKDTTGDGVDDAAQKDDRLTLKGHMPALDGIRGIAILLVVIYHSNLLETQTTTGDKVWYGIVGMGWTGVDVFFVLSGFLITGILLDANARAGVEKGGKAFVWRNFFARRVLRIFPLYFAFLAVHLYVFPDLGQRLGDKVLMQPVPEPLWFWLYVPNFLFAKLGAFVGPRPILAMWSLGIEEQFYLVWPLVVLFVARRHLPFLCVLGIAGALISRLYVYSSGSPWIEAFVLPHCRMDTLLLGALIAVWLRSDTRPTKAAVRKWAGITFGLSSIAIVATIFAMGALRQYVAPVYTIGFSVLAVWAASMMLLALASDDNVVLRRVFSFAPLRFCGRYAYGLYLTHTVVQHFVLKQLNTGQLYQDFGNSRVKVQLLFTLLSTIASIGAAVVVFHAFERHFLWFKKFVPMARPPRDGVEGNTDVSR